MWTFVNENNYFDLQVSWFLKYDSSIHFYISTTRQQKNALSSLSLIIFITSTQISVAKS